MDRLELVQGKRENGHRIHISRDGEILVKIDLYVELTEESRRELVVRFVRLLGKEGNGVSPD